MWARNHFWDTSELKIWALSDGCVRNVIRRRQERHRARHARTSDTDGEKIHMMCCTCLQFLGSSTSLRKPLLVSEKRGVAFSRSSHPNLLFSEKNLRRNSARSGRDPAANPGIAVGGHCRSGGRFCRDRDSSGATGYVDAPNSVAVSGARAVAVNKAPSVMETMQAVILLGLGAAVDPIGFARRGPAAPRPRATSLREPEIRRYSGKASPTRPHRLPLDTPDISHTQKQISEFQNVGTESFC